MTEAAELSPRQTTLLTAAVQVVAASGLRGLTHRAVDRQAGLPEGTCSAYLRTRLALLVALTRFVTSHFTREIAALTGRIQEHAGEDGYALAQTLDALRDWLDHPDLTLVRMELAIEGSRTPEIADLMEKQAEELVEIVEHVMLVAGHEHGRDRAVTLIAAFEGLLLRALREPSAQREKLLDDSLRLLLGSLVGLSEDEVTGVS